MSQAVGINDGGQVADASAPPGGFIHAFLWEYKALTDLGGQKSLANDINDAGHIVGMASISNVSNRDFLWRNGLMPDLGMLGGNGSEALGVGSSGQVVGFYGMLSGPSHALLWKKGAMQDLGSLSGPGSNDSKAYDINDNNQVIGQSGPVNLNNDPTQHNNLVLDLNVGLDMSHHRSGKEYPR